MGILAASIRGDFVARVTGLDLSRPLDDGDFGQVRDAFHRYAVLVFPEQSLTDEQQIAFSERFGPLEVSIRKHRPRAVERAEVSDLSNVDADGRLYAPGDERSIYNAGNRLWHSDSSFKRVPAMASLLSGREVPLQGGETEFADLRAAWDALPSERKCVLDTLVAEHSFVHSRGAHRLRPVHRRGAGHGPAGPAGGGENPPGDAQEVPLPGLARLVHHRKARGGRTRATQ
jgi:alpha-ketoglutarate-dependent 2,4-dichlorophenoxyacetate dioxygenase